MTPRWDAVLRQSAEAFINTLTEAEQRHCREIILNRLCDNPDQLPPSNHRGEIDRLIEGWHYRYLILNDNTIRITGIYYSPSNPKHPIQGDQPTPP